MGYQSISVSGDSCDNSENENPNTTNIASKTFFEGKGIAIYSECQQPQQRLFIEGVRAHRVGDSRCDNTVTIGPDRKLKVNG
jgi:hypothetical protein